MITCPKCNKELKDGSKFCHGCGAEIFEPVFCTECGKQTSSEFAFCQNCGAAISKIPAEEQPEAAPVPVAVEKKPFPKKAILFGGIVVAAIALIILIVSLLGGGASNNYALYIKDRELYFSNLKDGDSAWQLSSKLVDTEEVDNDDIADAGYSLSAYTYLSEDGKYIFFPDKIGDSEGLNLYYKVTDDPDADAVKIDSEVLIYSVDSKTSVVTYLKGEEGSLYQYSIKDDSKEKIAGDVNRFYVSDDGKELIYVNSEKCIYSQVIGEEKEKLASDIGSLEYVTEDLSTVYYYKEEALYKQVIGEEKEKVASDIYSILEIYDSGEIYYLTRETGELSLIDYVIDELKDSDAAMNEPEYPDYPSSPEYPDWWEYETTEEYNAAYDAYLSDYAEWEAECDRLEEEYYAAREAYWEKQSRDSLRASLESEVIDQSKYILHFYNGEEDSVVSESFAGSEYYSDYVAASKAPVLSFEAYKRSDVSKVNLTEIESVYDLSSKVQEALFSSTETYVAVKENATLLEVEDIAFLRINSEGTIIYYLDEVADEKNYGELYRIDISDGKLGKAEVYDSDVYYGYGYFVGNDTFEYFKEYNEGKGDLYIDKTRVDYDVTAFSVDVRTKLDKVFYLIDWNEEKEYGTLKVYDGDKTEKIADDVHDFTVTPDGRVLYLIDYSLNYYKGELHEWSEGETRKLDDDVICVLPIFDSTFRGFTYGW